MSLSKWNRVELSTATVVIAQNDPAIARALSDDLSAHFGGVMMAGNASEVRSLLVRHPKVQLAVLDLDLVDIEGVRRLASACCNLTIVCTHPSPDDRLWIAALNAGAVETCHPEDIGSIVRARCIVRARYQA
jgi:DNA-binding response OmpR family regulator